MKRKIKILINLFILGLVFYGLFLYFPLSWHKIENFCNNTTIGSAVATVKLRAQEKNFRVSEDLNNTILVNGPGFGRAVCDIRFENGKVIQATYVLLD